MGRIMIRPYEEPLIGDLEDVGNDSPRGEREVTRALLATPLRTSPPRSPSPAKLEEGEVRYVDCGNRR
ncbi:MAG TPA: hypothetical protein VHP83_00680 [Aggregatilineaceae bacterium]|nr:hypothetical protein [Aggregatilineaceae bacterium]